MSQQQELWQQEAHRLGGKELVAVITELRDTTRAIIGRLDASDKRHEEFLAKAFPSGDVDGHLRYHETVIEMLIERRRLRKAIEEKTISGLVWLLIMGIGTLLGNGIIRFIASIKTGSPS